ncbi:ATP-binding protein [Thermoactinomyces daqus]|uniref:histidine kinase n=2 Tax=Thermoactinomyces daqus TaxID=1329516 RepID=A0A7W1XCN3_9BACL|nr:ATP-binding protein [Thermoactinomyces daqus]
MEGGRIIRLLKDNRILVLLMAILVPLAGEFNIRPFHDDYRVSFGIPIFFFFLFVIRKIHPVISGVIVGFAVLVLRISLDFFNSVPFDFLLSVRTHIPASIFYIIYGLFFHLAKINRFQQEAEVIGFLGMGVEIVASLSELALRHFLSDEPFSVPMVGKIVLIAFVRNFFVLGVIFSVFKDKKVQEDQKIMLESHLYEVNIHLEKTLQYADEITKDGQELYRRLMRIGSASGHPEVIRHAQDVLGMAKKVHDIKQDNKRIISILSKLLSKKSSPDRIRLDELGYIVVRANQYYAEKLNKEIHISLDTENCELYIDAFTVLSLINNLVSNSVEAIEKKGMIRISLRRRKNWLTFTIADNGPGIQAKRLQRIFEAGYTTKLLERKDPFSGLGLSYVKEEVQKLGGRIEVQKLGGRIEVKSSPDRRETIFTIHLPVERLLRG